jgi:hypothetical protein
MPARPRTGNDCCSYSLDVKFKKICMIKARPPIATPAAPELTFPPKPLIDCMLVTAACKFKYPFTLSRLIAGPFTPFTPVPSYPLLKPIHTPTKMLPPDASQINVLTGHSHWRSLYIFFFSVACLLLMAATATVVAAAAVDGLHGTRKPS